MSAHRSSLRPTGLARPGTLLIVLLSVWALSGLLFVFGWLDVRLWHAIGASLLLLALVDWALLRGLPTPDAVREMADTLAIGMPTQVRLQLDPGARGMRLRVHDLHPSGWQVQDLPRRLHLRKGTLSAFAYRARPTERGEFRFDGVQLLIDSPLRLWRQSRISGAAQTVRVFPNFAPLTRMALMTAEHASRLVGAHMTRQRGEGTDFRQLREYRVGDSIRQIDWKATARARKLISREYQDEKHQQVLLVVDAGRRMLARDGDTTHFDHALDAALVVGYLALRQGDAVGLHVGGQQPRWLPPMRGDAALDALLRNSYDLQPQPVATDYPAAARELALRQRRRSLMLWITNVRDEDTDELLAAVHLLRSRHLVVVASLRESVLDAALDADVHDLTDALRVGATARYLQRRAAVHEQLRSHRVPVLDVTSAQLAPALVQEYLAIKRQGLL